MKEKFFTRGNIALFVIAFAVTLIAAIIVDLCGADRLSTVLTAPACGILSILLIGGLYEITGQKAPMGPDPGILGVVIGTLVTMIIY